MLFCNKPFQSSPPFTNPCFIPIAAFYNTWDIVEFFIIPKPFLPNLANSDIPSTPTVAMANVY